jgi:hypothetical protein
MNANKIFIGEEFGVSKSCIEKSLKSSHFFRNHVSYVFVVNEIILGKLS